MAKNDKVNYADFYTNKYYCDHKGWANVKEGCLDLTYGKQASSIFMHNGCVIFYAEKGCKGSNKFTARPKDNNKFIDLSKFSTPTQDNEEFNWDGKVMSISSCEYCSIQAATNSTESKVEFFKEKYYCSKTGESLIEEGCANLVDEEKNPKSLHVHNGCVKFYSEENCKGSNSLTATNEDNEKYEDLSTMSTTHDNKEFYWSSVIKSMSGCNWCDPPVRSFDRKNYMDFYAKKYYCENTADAWLVDSCLGRVYFI